MALVSTPAEDRDLRTANPKEFGLGQGPSLWTKAVALADPQLQEHLSLWSSGSSVTSTLSSVS